MRVLIVEDEAEFTNTLRVALERERFVVDQADCVSMAREAAMSGSYDLVLLDRTLPDGDGLSLVPILRGTHPGLPIIVLSARGQLIDRISGLDQGADDYLIKPFDIDEMFARIRAVRRRPAELGSEEIHVGGLVFDLTNDEASVESVRLDLTRRELRVLAVLVKRRGRTVLRESLEQAVFGFDDEVQSNTLDSHISRLRRKLAEANAQVEIHAIKGVGYLLKDLS
ncbi:response regulator transcription factor [Rhizobium sp. WYCCWR 11279]|uniref:Response regulator transcription factor n=1 Tax=Rhizobium changzhiense TaxID=2692317 RepID=A0A7Z0UHM5_9HYPH|nr:response regulator transcription factor [Rhizobium changzhiense]NNU49011.1 response regulator transcription factor [Rhizobium changzhiense]NZD65955.1 response regulator transcription factor [Rhizobium changzhiense]